VRDTPPSWLDDVPLRPGPPWLSMGTHALDLGRWLVVDDRRETELALKAGLLAEHHEEVVAALPGSEAAGSEVAEAVGTWLAEHHPGLPLPPVPHGLHPVDAAGRRVQEDLCLMEEVAGEWVLTAASVCFPSHWRIAEKLGRSVAAIHAPVPHYDDELRNRVDTFFSRLRTERPVWRRNLSIHSHADLFRPEPHESPESFGGGTFGDRRDLDGVWLRSEYQTLRRLPRSGAVVFTIRTQVCPAAVLVDRPAVATALAARLRSITPGLSALGERAPFPLWLPDRLEALVGTPHATQPRS